MIGLVFFAIAFVIISMILQVFKRSAYYDTEGRFRFVYLWRPIAAFLTALIVAAINPIDVERIDAGHVGIKVSNNGDNRGVWKTE